MKRKFKRIASLVLAAVMVFAMAMPAMATSEPELGSITVTKSDTVSVGGKTFTAYKILDVTLAEGVTAEDDEGFAYTVPSYMEDFFKSDTVFSSYDKWSDVQAAAGTGSFGALVAEMISEMGTADWMQEFARAALKYIDKPEVASQVFKKSATGAADPDPANKKFTESVEITDLEMGYYLVVDETDGDGEDTAVSALMLDTTAPEQTIKLKAEKPEIHKDIIEDGETKKDNDASIGDVIQYQVTSKVPDYTNYKYYTYVVTDTMTKGLTFDPESVSIKIGEKTLTQGEDLASGEYTVDYTTAEDTGITTITIKFKDLKQLGVNIGDDIQIDYSATVNEDAVIGKIPNTNDVYLKFSNDPTYTYDHDTDDDVLGETPKEEVHTYVTGIELTKVDNENPEAAKALKGAKFKVSGTTVNKVWVEGDYFVADPAGTYYLLKDGTYTTKEPNDDTEDQYAETTPGYKLEHKIFLEEETKKLENVEAFVNDDGVLVITGLSEGDYIITELIAPDGYNLLTEPINVKVTWGAPATGSTECTWSGRYQIGGPVTDGSEPLDWKETDGRGVLSFSVVNKSGAQLPETGGIGTTIFYVVGSVLVLGAVVLLVTKRRMKSE